MPLTKSDLEDMMKRQKEERAAEMQMLKEILMEGVRDEIKAQLVEVREELGEKVTEVREEFQSKVSVLEQKHNELSDVQSVIDSKVDKLEEEMKTLREMSKINKIPCEEPSETAGDQSENSEDISQLVNFGQRVIGFKPIEHRDRGLKELRILRIMRMLKDVA